MKFQTKKELLRYLWKNEDDRKLVDRMVARGEVRLEWRIYVLEEKVAEDTSADLEYLNKEYEKLEGLLDYSLRKCYGIMKKRGLVGSEDTYDDFYAQITEWYSAKSVAHTTEDKSEALKEGKNTLQSEALGDKNDLSSVMNKFGIKKASDLI